MAQWRIFGLTLALLACTSKPEGIDGGAGGGSAAGGGVGGGGSAGSGGGTASSDRVVKDSTGSAVVVLPAGAVDDDVPVTVTLEATDAGLAIKLSPDGLQLRQPAVVFFSALSLSGDAGELPMAGIEHVSSAGSEVPATFSSATKLDNDLWLSLWAVRVEHFSEVDIWTKAAQLAIAPSEGFYNLTRQAWTSVPGSESWPYVDIRPPDILARIVVIGRETAEVAATARSLRSETMLSYVARATGALEQPVPATLQLVTPDAEGKASLRLSATCARAGKGAIEADFSFTINGKVQKVSRRMRFECIEPMVPRPPPPPMAQVPADEPQKDAEAAYEAAASRAMTQLINDKEELAEQAVRRGIFALPSKLSSLLTVDAPRLENGTASIGHVQITAQESTTVTGLGVIALGDPLEVTADTLTWAKQADVGVNMLVQQGHMAAPVNFGYRCISEGTGMLVAYPRHRGRFDEEEQVGTARIDSTGAYLLPIICTEAGSGDALMLADNSRVSRSNGMWVASAPGVTANAIFASPGTDAKISPLNPQTAVFEGITAFQGVQGPMSFSFASSRQSATATWNATQVGYRFTGLTGMPAFDATDTVTVTATPQGATMPVTVMVQAPPPIADVNAMLGAPAGLATQVSLADGTFDVLYVYVDATSPVGGQAGFMRLVPAAQMALANGMRSAPLLDAHARSAVTQMGLTPRTLYVAAFRQQLTTAFFPMQRAVPVQAGRMFQLNAADLGP